MPKHRFRIALAILLVIVAGSAAQADVTEAPRCDDYYACIE